MSTESRPGTEQLVAEFSQGKKHLEAVLRLIGVVSRLSDERAANIASIRKALAQLSAIAEKPDFPAVYRLSLRQWVEGEQQSAKKAEDELSWRFGADLERELKDTGLQLAGQMPLFTVGYFSVEVKVTPGRVVIWYGPKQEMLEECKLSATEVARSVSKVKQGLGSGLDPQVFIDRLGDSVRRLPDSGAGAPVPINAPLPILASLLQDRRAVTDPGEERSRGYSRADYSFDLYRARTLKLSDSLHSKIGLTIATRAFTRNRRDCLWVADDDTGRGSMYSHLQLVGGGDR